MAVRRLNHAVLYVHGLERTVDFYRNTLGFEVRMEIAGRAAFLRAPDSANDHDLGLFEIGTGHAPDRPEKPGLYHLAWEVGTLADLADARAKLVAAGDLHPDLEAEGVPVEVDGSLETMHVKDSMVEPTDGHLCFLPGTG